eukprot:TRINITY_DN7842_c0_g1_i1.p1 TRINITY_DN7842_c0_g1~~TRINITY_DN7842_c0_g1_i1.p1  ORF type:complete len:505 (+),score=106.33 TRINITY_DN7842_c0_g1_i1:38-1552(+)
MEELQAITGMSEQDAIRYYEMAGGNVELAANLFFSEGDWIPSDTPSQPSQPGWNKPDWYTFVWPENKDIPASWIEQSLSFSSKEGHRLGIDQPKNGPCGVLAAIHGAVLAEMLDAGEVLDVNVPPSTKYIVKALSKILTICASEGNMPSIATWTGKVGEDVKIDQVPQSELESHLSNVIDNFLKPGGAVLAVYSAVLSRGVKKLRLELSEDGGQPPLVTGPNWLCTSDLVTLFMYGKPHGNVSAYDPVSTQKEKWSEKESNIGVGMISYSEIEAGVPIADGLKMPRHPIWLLHGGDHFTLLFSTKSEDYKKPNSTFTMYHWNGLPPAGPRMSTLTITAPRGEANPAPEKHVEKFYKSESGEIDDVVQSHPDDKNARPKEWKTWRYEVVLYIDDPSVKGAERPKDIPAEPKFTLPPASDGEPWRCASCYATRFKTMCFGLNKGGDKCQHCNKSKQDAGWSFWLHYNELPPKWQRSVTRRHAPKIISLLRTKWPTCEVGSDDLPSV